MAAQHDHGHTPAAWTGVIIAFVGFIVGGICMVAAQPVGFWVGIGIILLGPVVGGIMRLMGLGKADEPIAMVPATTSEDQARVHANA
ncbi:HGxxPAAW family protein [Actinacidiphila acidipaludis]|uniref:Uncharacterized protein n=1 Tax=Actinacidiphila acidipaludis TaxID=2873382 RepID=A0ABS7Q0F9_9ACTN|nr:HGxxPAAW family protein [Streptomyces acidipaludis]MBY8876621.1 hypothetical protein [Streptomyces acidipaludis]